MARRIDFAALPGWEDEDHAAALAAFFVTADLLGPGWTVEPGGDARETFERHFRPVASDAPPGLLTGYYEPELEGSPARTARFAFPLHAMPEGLAPGARWRSRAEIEAGDLLAGREFVWLDSPLEAFLAQVQGSVRVRLPEGRVLRLGFHGKNGHDYRSIGAELVRRGEVTENAISAQALRDWCAAHPEEVPGLLRTNPSYVFFRLLDLPPETGPLGAMGRPVTPLRSLAVDPAHVPLGAPVWVETEGPEPFRRLMVAQDTGSAIKGPQRGDIFFGFGPEAGERAGRMRDPGRLVTFLPVAMAAEIAPEIAS